MQTIIIIIGNNGKDIGVWFYVMVKFFYFAHNINHDFVCFIFRNSIGMFQM